MGTGTIVKPGDKITAAKMNLKLETVDTVDITDGAVTTAKIADAAITTAKIANDAVTLAKLENGTQGDILYYGANGEPARLPAGTAGQFLKTQGAGANPVWAAAPAGQWQVVSEVTTTSNVTYVDFTGLDINTDKVYILFLNVKNPTATNGALYLYVEGDYTTTNYYVQRLSADGTNVNAGRANEAQFFVTNSGEAPVGFVYIYRDVDGRFKWLTNQTRLAGSSIFVDTRFGSKTATVTNITQIRVSSNVTGGIGTGSHFLLCRPRS